MIKLIFGSSTGNTEEVAGQIQGLLNLPKDNLINVEDATLKDFENTEILILGISTWDIGQLQYDWDPLYEELHKVDFSQKTVALFGMGDQECYSDNFQDAMGMIYQKVVSLGAEVIGQWPTAGYEFNQSKAVVDGKFVGLALDNDNQPEKTEERIQLWCETLKKKLDTLAPLVKSEVQSQEAASK